MQVRKVFTIIFQLLLLLVLNEAGVYIVKIFHLPIPGNVMGMLLLFLLLSTGIIRLTWVEEVAGFLIKHLSFFFIPISVGLMTLSSVFIKNGIALLAVLVISTLLGIVVSGALSQALVRRKEAGVIDRDYHQL